MSNKVIEMVLDEENGTSILIETTETDTSDTTQSGGTGRAGIGNKIKEYITNKADETFAGAMSIISYSSNTILKEIDRIESKPESAQVEFGIKIRGDGKAMLATAGVEANYKVTLTWKGSNQ